MRPLRFCSVDGCNEPYSARDLCHNHYNRWHRVHRTSKPKRTPTPTTPGWRELTGAGPETEADDEAYRAMARDLGLSAARMHEIRGI